MAKMSVTPQFSSPDRNVHHRHLPRPLLSYHLIVSDYPL